MEGTHPLKTYRENHEPPLTQRRLADLLDVKKATVSRWETGTRRIDEARVQDVSKKTGIPVRDLRPDLAELLEAAQ